MATQYQRRPDGKEVPQPDQKVSVRQESEVDAKAKETQRQLEKGEAPEVSPEVAAAMQRGMGNSAVQGIMKAGSETSTATGSGETALDDAKEKETEEDQEKETEAGEIEHVLPIFSTGGGGGGAGAPGGSPWSVGKYFGGDDDAEPEDVVIESAKWRPMPFLPDPDDEEDIDAMDHDEVAVASERLALDEADSVLGSLSWRASVLGRGMRHPALLARRVVSPEMLGEGVSAVWLRARAMVRFLSVHAESAVARGLASEAADLGVPEGSLATAIAAELAIVEALVDHSGAGWMVVVDVAVDQRLRARAEQAAANRAQAGILNAPDLLAAMTDTAIASVALDWQEDAHPAMVAALERAARVGVLPALELWSPPAVLAIDEDLLAFDQMFALASGAPPPVTHGRIERGHVVALFASMNAVLGGFGAIQVEAAAAAAALAPHVDSGRLSATLLPLDGYLRQAARRLVTAGRAIESHIGTELRSEVRALSGEAAAVRGLAEFARRGAFMALAAHVSVPGITRADAASGISRGNAVLALSRARAAGEPVRACAVDVLAAMPLATAHAPYARVYASACLDRDALLPVAERMRAYDEPAALNLLKARYAEFG